MKAIDRLLSRPLELRDAYEELHSKLDDHPPALKVFFDPVDAIDLAAAEHYSYQHWVKTGLANIRGQFDLKYWPLLSEVVQAIGTDAAQARPLPHDPVTEAGTEGTRSALADTFRSFFVAVEESNARHHGFLPRTFELTNRSVAALISCALDLGPEGVVDAGYVKRLRQRRRDRDTGSAA